MVLAAGKAQAELGNDMVISFSLTSAYDVRGLCELLEEKGFSIALGKAS
ncbi:predicted protein [Sclerotinia sclerotiorum 1980 UF-70]|uniref:Uncharacterized protein n=1 Tax=Sclerotinia sclerotiorum (strain ATCC 18683 / 1980 / Ss-1) TaxID=665079 RepID=A7F5T2_SCLS1|nr:predicted protein [Sclerotinia sclerotiorum 1980 UF-70]EDN98103.1 predicted protein [Sclerotinia sclerotiorum 1980 UF-70]